MNKPIISTEIYSATATLGEERAVEAVAKAGFDAWDFSLFHSIVKYDWETGVSTPANHPLAGSNYLAFARQLKRIGEDNGIFCNQSHAPFPISCKAIEDNLKRCLELTAEAGGKICVIHPNNNKSPEENAETYFKLLPFAKQVGVKIATENMWNWNSEKGHAVSAACSHHDDFLAHIKAVNDDYLVACLDLGHAEMKGLDTSITQMVKTLGSNLQALHIHDNDKLNDKHWLPYTMDIDFTAAAKALKEIGYKGEFTMEADAYITKQPDIYKALKDMAVVARRFANEFENA